MDFVLDFIIKGIIFFAIVLFVMSLIALGISGKKKKETVQEEEPEINLTRENDSDNRNTKKVEKQSKAAEDMDAADRALAMKLMGYDDARLQEIIASPDIYNADCMRVAGKILGRRKAWVWIKNLPDTELIKYVSADRNLYDENVVGAASMELYQRNSPLLLNQLINIPADILTEIADGNGPEGIRLAARKILRQKTNGDNY